MLDKFGILFCAEPSLGMGAGPSSPTRVYPHSLGQPKQSMNRLPKIEQSRIKTRIQCMTANSVAAILIRIKVPALNHHYVTLITMRDLNP